MQILISILDLCIVGPCYAVFALSVISNFADHLQSPVELFLCVSGTNAETSSALGHWRRWVTDAHNGKVAAQSLAAKKLVCACRKR